MTSRMMVLVLGNIEIVRGLIQQVEHFAAIQFGDEWHGNLEEEQLEELFGSLKEHEHIDLLDFELKQEHIGLPNQNEIGLDIDFFIRDNRTKRFTPCNSSILNRVQRRT